MKVINNASSVFFLVTGKNKKNIIAENFILPIGAQALLVVTEWNQFRNPDFERIKELLSAPILFDGRNLYSPQRLADRGFAYFCVGRKS